MNTKTEDAERLQQIRERCEEAMAKDIQQWMVQSMTPQRAYGVPIDNVWQVVTQAIAARDAEIERAAAHAGTLQSEINRLREDTCAQTITKLREQLERMKKGGG